MGRRAWAIGTLCLLLLVGASGMVQANENLTYEPGFVEWSILPHERLFVEGWMLKKPCCNEVKPIRPSVDSTSA